MLPRSIVILGGTGAVSAAVEAQLHTYSAVVNRVSGPDRYATAVALSKAEVQTAGAPYVATGLTFPDALAGGPVVGAAKQPLLLVPGTCVPGVVRDELLRLGASKLELLGGQGAVNGEVAALTPC